MNNNQEPNLGWTEALGSEGTNPANPRTNGETLIALGREWTVSSLESRLKAQFEKWCRTNAKRAISEADMEDGPEEAGAMRSAYAAALGAGHYSWDGRYCRSARGDLPGIRYLLFLLIRRCHPEVTEDQVEKMFQENPKGCGMALRWALGNMGEVEAQSQSQSNRDGNRHKIEADREGDRGRVGNVMSPGQAGVVGLTEEEKELIAYARKKRQEEREERESGGDEIMDREGDSFPQKNLIGRERVVKDDGRKKMNQTPVVMDGP